MLSPELEHILQLLYREARNARYEFISLEHLLLVLIEEDAAVPNVLKLCGADLKVLSEQLAASVAENTPQIPDHLLDTVETQPTLGFQRVIQRAMVHTQSAGKAAVEPLDILVAMMSESESHAVYFLKLQSITRFEVLRCIAHGSPDDEDGNDSDGLERESEEAEQKTGSLSDYTVNLNAEVKAGRIDPLIGRKHEMERLVQIMPPPQKQSTFGRRSRRGQNRAGGRSGASNRQRRHSRCAERSRSVRTGYGFAFGRHEIPRRL